MEAGNLHLYMLVTSSDFIISSAYMHIMYFDHIHPSIAHFCSFLCPYVDLLFSCPTFFRTIYFIIQYMGHFFLRIDWDSEFYNHNC